MTQDGRRRRVLHVFTVADSIGFLRGQPAFFDEAGWELAVACSGAPPAWAAAAFARAFEVEIARRVSPIADLRAIAQVVSVIGSFKPTLVHAHTPKGGLVGVLAGALCGLPVVYHMRGSVLETATGVMRPLLWGAEWVTCHFADRVVCVSHSLRDSAISMGVVSEDKAVVLAGGSGNGVDANGRFDPSAHASARDEVRAAWGVDEQTVVAGFVGRLANEKGIRELVQAAALLAKTAPSLRIALVGDIDERDPVGAGLLEQIAAAPNLFRVEATALIERIYAGFDLVVLPTYREGLPNVLLEAAAMALPVVATRVTGCVDVVVDGETGLLVAARDGASLAEAMARYVEDAELRRNHGGAARARVLERFAQPRIWGALERLYCEVTGTTRVEQASKED
jgi:glycosyltransferase involved in cell wall biosynthesis